MYYELLKPDETVTAARYGEQLINLKRKVATKRQEWTTRHECPILLHDNARPHVAKPVINTIKELNWEILPYQPYSFDIYPLDYHLFRSITHKLTERKFTKQEEVQKRLEKLIASKQQKFFFD